MASIILAGREEYFNTSGLSLKIGSTWRLNLVFIHGAASSARPRIEQLTTIGWMELCASALAGREADHLDGESISVAKVAMITT